MKRYLYAAIWILCSSSILAQQQPNSLPDGVRIPVSLMEDWNVQHLRVGDRLRLLVTNNLRGPSGAVVVPKDAIGVGRVLERELVSKNREARLYLMIEEVSWKGGSLSLHAFVVPPLRPTKVLKIDLAHPDPMFRPDIELVGIGSHDREGTYLYCRKNFVLDEGTSFSIEQMSKPGPSAPPAIR